MIDIEIHCARQNSFKNIFYSGFESFYIKSGAGSMYGPGVYSTSDLESSINNARKGTYGKIIIKAALLDVNRFIIFDEKIAKNIYGENYTVEKQLSMFFKPEDIEDMKKDGTYNYVTKRGEYWTSHQALRLYYYCAVNRSAYNSYEGLFFRGRNDGNVAVIKHVKNLVPISYSTDYGRTFIEHKSDETIDNTINSFDQNYLIKDKKYVKKYTPKGGLGRVENSEGKFNFVDKNSNELSPMWFDSASDFTKDLDGNFISIVFIGDDKFYITTHGDIYESMDDLPIGNVKDLTE